jgi:hypothetical protein
MATPYVISSDLVSAYPAKSLEIAQYIDGFKADLALVQNAQTGTTYSFVAADFTKLVTLSNASPVAVELPLEATVPWPTGTSCDCSTKAPALSPSPGRSGSRSTAHRSPSPSTRALHSSRPARTLGPLPLFLAESARQISATRRPAPTPGTST